MNLFNFKNGDRVYFEQEYDTGFAPDDILYDEPIAAGEYGTILDVAHNHVRIKMDNSERWPRPILVWDDDAYPNDLKGGTSCLRKIAR